jgi:cellulose synthase (UDP-forming)
VLLHKRSRPLINYRYLNERLSMGLAAESLEGYFTQRARWCRGAIQTLFLKSGPLGPGLSFLQRLLFFPLDWLIQYPLRLVALAVPIIFLWTGVAPFVITSTDELIAYQLPAYIAITLTFRFFAPNRYIPILSTAVSLFTSLRIAPTVLASLIKPFGAPFRVTPKGSNNTSNEGDWAVLMCVTILIALTLSGLIANRISAGSIPGSRAAMVAAELYALFNLIVLMLAAAMALERPRPRNAERFPVRLPVSYRLCGCDLPCEILDISETGAMLRGVSPLGPDKSIELEIPRIGLLPAKVVRQTGLNTAVEFSPISEQQRWMVIDLIYSSGLSNGIDRLDITQVVSRLFSYLFGIPDFTRGRRMRAQPLVKDASHIRGSHRPPSRLARKQSSLTGDSLRQPELDREDSHLPKAIRPGIQVMVKE